MRTLIILTVVVLGTPAVLEAGFLIKSGRASLTCLPKHLLVVLLAWNS